MSIYTNGTKIKNVYVNGTKMKNVYVNGTRVYSAIPDPMPSFTPYSWSVGKSGESSSDVSLNVYSYGVYTSETVWAWGNWGYIYLYENTPIEAENVTSVTFSYYKNTNFDEIDGFQTYIYVYGSNDGSSWSTVGSGHWYTDEKGKNPSATRTLSISPRKYLKFMIESIMLNGDQYANHSHDMVLTNVVFNG